MLTRSKSCIGYGERARHVEKVLCVVWASVTPLHFRAVQEFRPVLVASGGLARGEIYPKSDVDVRVIYAGSITGSDRLAILARLLDGLRRKFRGFKWLASPALIGIEEALRLARLEPEFFSALLEARVIAGNIDTFLAFEDKFWSQCVKEMRDQYLRTRIEDRRARIKSLNTVTPILGVNVKRRDWRNVGFLGICFGAIMSCLVVGTLGYWPIKSF